MRDPKSVNFHAVANLQMEELENEMWIKTNVLVDDGRGLVDRALLPVKTVAGQAATYLAVQSALQESI